MSRSRKNFYKMTFCRVRHKEMTDWKNSCRRYRRRLCKHILHNNDIDVYDEIFFPNKFQHDMKMTNDWFGPHDGYLRHQHTKEIIENKERPWQIFYK